MNRIWAIGASVRALASSLVRSGYQVVAADLFNDLDLQRIATQTQRIVDYPSDLLTLVDAVQADAFVYTGGLENYPDLIDALATKLPLLGNPSNVLRRVRNVAILREVLERSGFQMPPMAQAIPAATRNRWLRKSRHSSGGLRISWADLNCGPLAEGEYFQEFIEGSVYGASFVAIPEGAQLLGVTRQLADCPWTSAPRFHYAGSIGPLRLSNELKHEIARLGELLANEFHLRGWFGVDCIVDSNERLWVLEVNPRYTASLELLESRDNSPGQVFGKAILYAQRRICVTTELVQRLLLRSDVADIPCPGSEIPAGSPVLTLLAQGPSQPAVMAALQTQAGELQAELSQATTALSG